MENCTCLFKHDQSEACEIVIEETPPFKSRITEAYAQHIINLYADYEREYAEKLDALESSRNKFATVSDWHQAFVEGLRPATGAEKVLSEFLYANRRKLTDKMFSLLVEEGKITNFTDEAINHYTRLKGDNIDYCIWGAESEFGTVVVDTLVIIKYTNCRMVPIEFKADAELVFQIINANLSC